MAYKLIVKSLAEDDIRGIVEWYAEQSKQPPSKFLLKLSIGLDSITKNPEHYQKRFDQVRIHFLKKFPYGIYYTIQEHTVFVHAVLHTKRNPLIGIKRV
ncbi:MAG TPA: type II toxin-antitoxin system RelE/ParE family toxin [Flavobacterium sp.]|nr:type II toxin-antitoxin system RelE/ParE family toxin [Flavobacterium sp.]